MLTHPFYVVLPIWRCEWSLQSWSGSMTWNGSIRMKLTGRGIQRDTHYGRSPNSDVYYEREFEFDLHVYHDSRSYRKWKDSSFNLQDLETCNFIEIQILNSHVILK